MTLIVGIRCEDGIVLGADGAATLGALGGKTVQQPCRKLAKISDCIIIGTSGPVGLGQIFSGTLQDLWTNNRLSGKSPHEAMAILREAFWQHAEKEFKAAQVTVPMLGQVSLESALSFTLLAMPLRKQPCLFQFNQQCSPELASGDLPFISIGSGQQLADPFLAFLRRVFWPTRMPKVTEGVLATVWSLDQAIRTNPGGVGNPIQVMTLEKDGADWKVKELGETDFSEHRQAISTAESALAEFRTSFKPAPGDTEPPKPATT
jgi:20S proteasome alpha/beta subunit